MCEDVVHKIGVGALLYSTFVVTYKYSKGERGSGLSVRDNEEVVSRRWG